MQKLFALIVISIILSQAYAQNSCGPGAASCSSSSNSTYQSCLSGWYTTQLTGGNVGCSLCPFGSLTCSSPIQAITCLNGYTLQNGLCAKCSVDLTSTCQSTCNSGAGFITSGSTCLACESQSGSCASGCQTQGYFTQGTTCVKCPLGSSACSSSVLSSSCISGYYLASGGVCTQCPQGQLSCAVSVVSQTCKQSYYLSPSKICTKCAADTQNPCNSSCTQGGGFVTVGSTCVACSVSSTLACQSGCLNQGFVVTGTTDKPTCDACPSYATSCSSSTVALTCQSGYFLDKAGVCTQCSSQTNLQSNQITCIPAAQPVTCNFGFTISRTSCVTCLSNTDKCNTDCSSNQGYFTVNSTCIACQTGAKSCTNTTVSLSCRPGYLLLLSTCTPVNLGTITQGNPASLSSGCMSNYYYQQSDSSCQKCQSIGMNQCTDNGKTAVSCITGYADAFNGYCVECPNGASSCTLPNAVKCLSGFFLRAGVCTACNNQAGTLVDSCNNEQASQHLGCTPNNYLLNGVCTACSGTAIACYQYGQTKNDQGVITTGQIQHTQCQAANFVALPFNAACTTTNFVANSNPTYQFEASKTTKCQSNYWLATDKLSCIACATVVTHVAQCKSATAIDTCNPGYVLDTNNRCLGCIGTNVKTCTYNKFYVNSLVCATGYYTDSVQTCASCATSSTLKAAASWTAPADGGKTITAAASIINQAQITDCTVFTNAGNTYTSPSAQYNTLSRITCAAGYSPLLQSGATTVASQTQTASIGSTSGSIWGCYSCGSNVKSCKVPGSASSVTTGQTITDLICNDNYYQDTATTCAGICNAGTTLLPSRWDAQVIASTNVISYAASSMIGFAKIVRCAVFTTASTSPSYTAAATGTVDAVRYRSARSITCAAGYTAVGFTGQAVSDDNGLSSVAKVDTENTAGGAFGCVQCGTNIKTCSVAAVATPSTATTIGSDVVCQDGFYISADKTCLGSCNGQTALPTSWSVNDNPTLISYTAPLMNYGQITKCEVWTLAPTARRQLTVPQSLTFTAAGAQGTVTAARYLSIRKITCALGYAPQQFTGSVTLTTNSDGTVSAASTDSTAGGILGCAKCNSDITGIASCTVTAITAAQFAAGTQGTISSVTCQTGYIQVTQSGPDGVYCVSIASNLVGGSSSATLTFKNTDCISGRYLKTDNTCADCNSNIATCLDGTAGKALSCNENFLFVPSTTATDKSGICVACNGAGALAINAKVCAMNSPYVSSTNACQSNYQMFQGQCFACPPNANGCTKIRPTQCSIGYYNNDGTCTQCTDTNGAKTCSSATGTLGVTLTCKDNYYNTAAVGAAVSCSACGAGASSCTSNLVHTNCYEGYSKIGSTTVCAACGTGAKTCSTASTVHTSCFDGYQLISGTCSLCMGGVKACSDATSAVGKASSCLDGFYISSSNCYPCGANVKACTDQVTPTACNSGFSLVGGSCIICPTGAISCTATNVATGCRSGYFLSLGSCIACPTGVASCSSTLYATSCSDNYYLSSGNCVQCTTGAKTCDASASKTALDGYFGTTTITACSEGSKTCSSLTQSNSCNDGYSIVSPSLVCQKCTVDNAKSCTNDLSKAVDCISGYSQVSDKCILCPSNALSCSATNVVVSCATKYVKSGDSSVCLPCLVGTNTCSAPVSNNCLSGYQPSNGVCTACANANTQCITECSSNVGFVTVSNTCVACGTGAKSCQSPSLATTCYDGYKPTVVNGACVACGTGVATCDDSIVLTCQISLGYIASTTSPITCVQCGQGVKTCKDAKTATDCLDGYYLTAISTCSACTNSNAATCIIQGQAQSCASTYYPIDGVCLACGQSASCPAACLQLGFFNNIDKSTNTTTCSSCNAPGTASCSSTVVGLTCLNGYYLNAKSVCTPCSDNTLSCSLILNQVGKSDSCNIGFFNNQNGQCIACPANFATCSSATNGTNCINGYYLSTPWTTCTACPSPSSQCTSATSFQSCVDGYYPTAIGGQDVSCTQCNTANNVVACYNSTYATKCSAGFSAVNGSCSQCPTNAQSCNGILIIQCKQGFYIVNQYIAANNTCNQCGTGAATCQNSSIALTCLPGYGLNGQTCQQCGTGASACTGQTATACFAQFTLSGGVCQCAAGQGPSADGQSCGSCPANCATCSSVSSCTQCNNLFTLNGTQCSSTCGASQFYSTSTASKRILQSCVDCPKGCATCTSASSCTTCSSGFSLSGSACNANLAGKLIGNILLIIALFAFIIKQ